MHLIVLSAVPDAITNIYVVTLRVRHRLARAARLNLGMGLGSIAILRVLLPSLGIIAVGWAWLGMQIARCAYVVLDPLRRRNQVGDQRLHPGAV